MMKKTALLLIVLTIIIATCFSFVGCSGGNDGDNSSGGNPVETTSETTPETTPDSTSESTSVIDTGDKDADIKYNIVLSDTEIELDVGESKILHATYGNKTMSFVSSDNAVATVDASGNITAKAIGTAYITVSCEGKSKICKVTVVKTVWTVEIDGEENVTAKTPFNKEYTAAVYKNGEKCTAVVDWNAANGAELTVDGNTVRIYIDGAGTYTLTATYKGDAKTITITVIAE